MRPTRLLLLTSMAAWIACTSAGCVTMYAMEAPHAPRPGHIPAQWVSEVHQGRIASEVQAMFGAPLAIERRVGEDVWEYRVLTTRCTKVTKWIFGFTTTRVPPPDHPVVRVVVRGGVVAEVEGMSSPSIGERR